MYFKSTKVIELDKQFLQSFRFSNDCKVSKASTEIMLDRFCNGYQIKFPLSK